MKAGVRPPPGKGFSKGFSTVEEYTP